MQSSNLLKPNFVGITAAVAMCGLLIFALATAPVAAQGQSDSSTRTISVSGSGEVFGPPDIAYINLGVDVADADAGKAIANANTTLAAIVAAVSEAGVAEADIQTANYSVYPEDRYDPQTGQATGERIYHVQLAVNVTVRDISKTGAVIQAGLSAGANSINGLSFGIADMKSLEEQARKAAVADAQNRAQQLADGFGVTLGAPVTISESFGSVPVPMFNRDMVAQAASVPVQINPGQLSVSVQVNVTFAIAG
ncbi:MAG: SIMPL domain-containing protein [Anaerolineae bacterium]